MATKKSEEINATIPLHEEHEFTTAVSGADDSLGLQSTIETTRLTIVILLK